MARRGPMTSDAVRRKKNLGSDEKREKRPAARDDGKNFQKSTYHNVGSLYIKAKENCKKIMIICVEKTITIQLGR